MSRRDNTLLTVDFNLRTRNVTDCTQVPKGRHFLVNNEERRVRYIPSFFTLHYTSVVPAGLCNMRTSLFFRRLKSTVNKMSSLRDYAECGSIALRRLKSTVNKMSSLRDYFADNLMRHFTINLMLVFSFQFK